MFELSASLHARLPVSVLKLLLKLVKQCTGDNTYRVFNSFGPLSTAREAYKTQQCTKGFL